MNSYFKIIDIDDAINILQNIKKKKKNKMVLICTIDFDNEEESRKITTPDEGCVLVEKSKTIIMNEDHFIPHMELYSVPQNDIKNIIKKGIMHDIIFSG